MSISIVAVLLTGCGDESTAERIIDKLPEGGPPLSADRCVLFGADGDGRDVFRCFEDESSSSSVGCFSIGGADNLIQHNCSSVARGEK